jgi:hypothetical protein
MAAIYRLNADGSVTRASDGAVIPNDPRNADWRDYQVWLGAGSTPDPAPAPVTPKAPPTPRQWLERLAPATESTIFAAAMGNAAILQWLFKAAGNPTIDVTAAETISGVEAMAAAGLITAQDQATLLAP